MEQSILDLPLIYINGGNRVSRRSPSHDILPTLKAQLVNVALE